MAFKRNKPNSEDAAAPEAASAPPVFSEKEKNTAKKWFKHGDSNRDKHDYDYAIESYITGLGFWPEAVEAGHMPLRSIAIQRAQVGGKKPTMMEKMKRSTSGKDLKQAMLNAEYLVCKDPLDGSSWDAFMKNAVKGGYLETALFGAPLCIESLKRDKKLSPSRFKNFRELMIEAGEMAIEWGKNKLATGLLEKGMESIDYQMSRTPGDDTLRNEQRNLAGKLAIAKGKYEDADTFRDSLQDAESQKLLHDAERGRQSENTLEAAIASLRKQYEADPSAGGLLNRYIDALIKTEQKNYEDEAIAALTKLYEESKQYSHKMRADNIRLSQLKRDVREIRNQAKASGSEDDLRTARLATQDYNQTELDILKERVAEYPTDLRIKFQYGRGLFTTGQYHEAIPILQDAQSDPRVRHQALKFIGRAFHETGAYSQAAEVLREASESYEMNDELSRELMYALALAFEADGKIEEAKSTLGKLLRIDYNYAGGDARKLMEKLNKKQAG
ncbi:MAG: hypothetical protein AB7N71_04925 [Phycisphaerae bacterium]